MKEGLRSGKLKVVEKEKASFRKTVVVEKFPHLDSEIDNVGEKKKVEGEPVVGRVLRSNKKRPLADKDETNGEVSGEVQIPVRNLRSRTVMNAGCGKAGSDGGKILDDGVKELKVRVKEVDGERPIVVLALRALTVANGECDKAESGVDMAESEIVGASGNLRKSSFVDDGENIVHDAAEEKKVREKVVDGRVSVGSRVLRSRTVVNGENYKAENENVGASGNLRKSNLVDDGENIVDDAAKEKKVKKKVVDVKVSDSSRVLRSRTVANGENYKAESDVYMAESENVGASGNLRKSSLVDDGENIVHDAAEEKKVKEKVVDGKVSVGSRVLRSRTVANGENYKAESENVGASGNFRNSILVGDGENIVHDAGEEKKVKEKVVDGKVSVGSEVLQSRTVANGESGKAENDVDMAESENVGASGNLRKSNLVDDGENIVDDAAEEKKVKDKIVDGKVSVGSQVLQSQTVANGESDMAESDAVLVGGSKWGDGFDKKFIEEKNEGGVQLVGFTKKVKGKRGRPSMKCSEEKNEGGVQLVGFTKKVKGKRGRPSMKCSEEKNEGGAQLVGFTKKVKGKRGRPSMKCSEEKNEGGVELVGFTEKVKGKRGRPSMKCSEEYNGDGQLVQRSITKVKRKRGRPPKAKEEESERASGALNKHKLGGKRGRPQKEEKDLLDGRLRKKLRSELVSCKVLKGNHDKEGNMDLKLKLGLKLRGKLKSNTETNVSYLERKLIGKEGEDLETGVTEDEEGQEKQNKKGNKTGRNKLKWLVSEKITQMVLTAGWTIERRQRNGRAYMDAVFVCPAGKTHWSVTKAYRALEERCAIGDSTVCEDGFKFTPLPPEELSLLKRVVVKKRRGKICAKTKGKGGNTSDGDFDEKRKKKTGKSLKRKHSLIEQETSTGTACEGKLSLVRHHKRQKTQNRKRCALLVRNSECAGSENDGYIPYDGKRTVLSWMIDLGTLSVNSKLKYMNKRKKQVLLEGKVARDGIHCSCCEEIIGLSEFVTHASKGYSVPLRSIYTDSGSSLLQCLLVSWNKQEESEHRGFHLVEVTSEDPNDDTCGICGDGGNLICCDGCPSTFHQNCLDIKKFPTGDWLCVYCSCKFCGISGGHTCQSTGSENIALSALLTCQLCEGKYHQCCIQAKDSASNDSCSPSFCGENCQELFEKLQMLLGVKQEVEEGFSLTLLRRFDVADTPEKVDCDSKLIECNSKLAVAFLVMDECFLPMVDHRSGVNLIHNILYNRGSNFNRLNYSGFVTAILEKGDEMISAATIRIHGNSLAEMPFIGTRSMYRRQGMCRRLLNAIESTLCSLQVERLVIPAISELKETWTSVFGFNSLEESGKQKMKNVNMLVFPGVDILQKPLKQLSEPKKSPMNGWRSTELEHHKFMQDVACDNDEGLVSRFDSGEPAACVHEVNDEPAAIESDTHLLCGASHDNLESKSNTITIHPDSVRTVREPSEEIYEHSASVPHASAVKVGANFNQQETLCDTDEGLLAGSVVEATVSCINRHEANDELAAVESDAQHLDGVSHENLERKNDTITVPIGSVSDIHEPTEEIRECQNSVSVADGRAAEVGANQNKQEALCDTNDGLLAGSVVEATVSCRKRHEANDELAAVESDAHRLYDVSHDNLERKNNTVTVVVDLNSDIHEPTEEISECQNSASVADVEGVKLDNKQNLPEVERESHLHSEGTDCAVTILCDSVEGTQNIDHQVKVNGIAKPISSQDEGPAYLCTETNDSELQTLALVHEAKVSEENIVSNSQVCHDHSPVQHKSIVMVKVHSEDMTLAKTSNIARDVFHQTAPLSHEEADVSKGQSTSFNYLTDNGLDTRVAVSTLAENNSHPSCAVAILNSNVTDVDSTSKCALMKTKSLQQTEFDSEVDGTSLRESNSTSTSAVGLQCGADGGNSCGTLEVTMLSNHGQAS